MKIVVLDGYALNPGDISWELIKQQGEFVLYKNTPKSQVIENIGDAEIVFTNKTAINAEILKSCPNIKYIGVLATGYNVVDVEACNDRGIVVTNVPTYGTSAVAQYTMAFILELCHHIGEHNRSVKQGNWQDNINFSYWDYPLMELGGRTLGVIGFGRIGQMVAKLASAFGMNIIAYDKFPNQDYLKENMSYDSLDNLFSKSDFISLNCPLTQENKGMINSEAISKMKDGVYIVNTARGPLINEADLVKALNSGKVKGAAVDVLAEEPPINGSPLIDCERCIVTPHIAWAAKESRERLMNIAASNLKAFIAGKPVNTVS